MLGFIQWKWSDGKPYNKSSKQNYDEKEIENNKEIINLNKTPEGFIHKQKKLDGQNEKLSNRYMIVQKGMNPFVDTNNYINHIDMETSFLRPINSNFSEKNNNLQS
jgi:hypothetical protein